VSKYLQRVMQWKWRAITLFLLVNLFSVVGFLTGQTIMSVQAVKHQLTMPLKHTPPPAHQLTPTPTEAATSTPTQVPTITPTPETTNPDKTLTLPSTPTTIASPLATPTKTNTLLSATPDPAVTAKTPGANEMIPTHGPAETPEAVTSEDNVFVTHQQQQPRGTLSLLLWLVGGVLGILTLGLLSGLHMRKRQTGKPTFAEETQQYSIPDSWTVQVDSVPDVRASSKIVTQPLPGSAQHMQVMVTPGTGTMHTSQEASLSPSFLRQYLRDDPFLEAKMRQTQMGIFVLPGQERHDP
jgi:hypothetical protein